MPVLPYYQGDVRVIAIEQVEQARRQHEQCLIHCDEGCKRAVELEDRLKRARGVLASGVPRYDRTHPDA